MSTELTIFNMASESWPELVVERGNSLAQRTAPHLSERRQPEYFSAQYSRLRLRLDTYYIEEIVDKKLVHVF